MRTSIKTGELTAYLVKQLNTFFPDRRIEDAELHDIVIQALERVEHSFSHTRQKNYWIDGAPAFNHLNTDHYAQFLYFVGNAVFRNGGEQDLAEKSFGLNKALHGLDLFYEVEMPGVFLLQHPVGTVLGRAKYGDYLFVAQNVTIGGNLDLNYPAFGEGVALYSGSKVVGKSNVGNNCWLAAGTIVRDEEIASNTVTFGITPDTQSKPVGNNVVQDIFKMAAGPDAAQAKP